MGAAAVAFRPAATRIIVLSGSRLNHRNLTAEASNILSLTVLREIVVLNPVNKIEIEPRH